MAYVIDYDQVVPEWTLPARFEVAFGARWYTDLTDPAVVWTDLRGRFIAANNPTTVTWQRGRTLSSGDMARTPQPGSLSVRLDSADGWLTPDNPASPYYPEMQPGLPIRWSVFDGSTWQVEFTGYLTDVDPSAVVDGIPDWTQVDLTATDGWSRVMQAGDRRAYTDRVTEDLLAPRSLGYASQTVEWLRGGDAYAGGMFPAPDATQVGVSAFRLGDGGTLAWSDPGAAAVVAEFGGGTIFSSGGAPGFGTDRFGGESVKVASTWATVARSGNLDQVSIGRPPAQLLPASAYQPVDVASSGMVVLTGTGTITVTGAPSAAEVAPRLILDPATGATTPQVDGPATTYTLTFKSTATTFGTPKVPVTAGQSYAVTSRQLSGVMTVATQAVFYDASGATVAASGSGGVYVAPVGAVTARLVLAIVGGSAGTAKVHAPSLTAAQATGLTTPGAPTWVPPAAWWPIGASDHLMLYGQWPVVGGGGAVSQWLHFAAQVDGLTLDELHEVTWSVGDGHYDVWLDGAASAGTWWYSPSTTSPADNTTPWGLAAATGLYVANSSTGAQQTQPPVAELDPVAVVVARAEVNRPTDEVALTWWSGYAAALSADLIGTTAGTTDVVMGALLDGLGWPTAMRDMETGVASSSLSWGYWDTDPDLGNYGTDIGNLAQAEFGWADVDGRGFLRWLPRRWYDPDGDGTALAAMHLTWESGIAGSVTYTTALTQAMGEGDVINVVTAANTDEPATFASRAVDTDSRLRLGVRQQDFVNPAWDSLAAVDDVTEEVLGLYGRPRLLAPQVVVNCYGADDAYLPLMLALNPADVVAVTVPRAPAVGVTLGCLVLSKAVTTDGLVTTFTLGLGACPVPVAVPTTDWSISTEDADMLLAPDVQATDPTDADVLLVDVGGQVSLDGADPDRLLIDA